MKSLFKLCDVAFEYKDVVFNALKEQGYELSMCHGTDPRSMAEIFIWITL